MVNSKREIDFSVEHSVERSFFILLYCVLAKTLLNFVAFTKHSFSIRMNCNFYFNIHRN